MSRSILSPVLTLNSYNSIYQDHIFDLGNDGGCFDRVGRGADILNPLIKWFVCQSRLRNIFEIPKVVTKIQFRAYSEPGRGRTKVKFIVGDPDPVNGYLEKLVFIDDHGNEFLVDNTFDAIKTLAKGRKTWYVNVYYWE